MTRRLWLSVLVGVCLLGACNGRRTELAPAACRVVNMTDQLNAGGVLTDQMRRVFTYTGDQLSQLEELNTDRQAKLTVSYNGNGQVIGATDGSFGIAFDYGQGAALPVRATTLRNGVTQAIYELAYSNDNKLARVFETRQVLPGSSTVRSREYLFIYDDKGNIATEKLKSTLTDKSTVEQETDYTFGTGESPMAKFSQPVLFAVTTLSQYVESMPARYLQQQLVQGYKTYNAKNGVRSTVKESATFTPITDASNQLTGLEQNTTSNSGSGQTFVRKNVHTFTYNCQ